VKKILLFAPKHYIVELQGYYNNPKYKIVYKNSDEIFKRGLKKYLDNDAAHGGYDGYLGLADDSVQIAAILAQRYQKPAPTLSALFNCQNKLASRSIQRKVVPEMAVESFSHLDFINGKVRNLKFPLFIKPVRASMSFFAHEVTSEAQLRDLINSYNPWEAERIKNFKQIYELGLLNHPKLNTYTDLICEEFIKNGSQINLDGYCYGGKVYWFGITHSIFWPNRISFKRFEFPMKVGHKEYTRLTESATKLLKAIGLDNSLFNMELKLDLKTGQAKIIEINPRPAGQFMYPIQVVTGVHPLDVALDIAANEHRFIKEPSDYRAICSVCVLRRPTDAKVIKLPQDKTVKELTSEYPGLRVNYFAWPGDKLSDYPQDSFTYRYAEVVIPHRPSENINQILSGIEQKLNFQLADI